MRQLSGKFVSSKQTCDKLKGGLGIVNPVARKIKGRGTSGYECHVKRGTRVNWLISPSTGQKEKKAS